MCDLKAAPQPFMSCTGPLIDAVLALIHVKAQAETEPDTCAMVRPSTRRSTALLLLVAVAHCGAPWLRGCSFFGTAGSELLAPCLAFQDARVAQGKGGSNSKG